VERAVKTVEEQTAEFVEMLKGITQDDLINRITAFKKSLRDGVDNDHVREVFQDTLNLCVAERDRRRDEGVTK
jgi:hypothetical protein